MGRRMLRREPAFAAALAEADEHIRTEAGFSVLDVVRGGEDVSGCDRIQPVLFALQTALAATWRAYGIEPSGVIGHSMGEVAAAVVAGALSPADGARVICRRSALLTRIAGNGAMATVSLDSESVEAELAAEAGAVCVAVLGAPDSTVVAGDTARVKHLVARWNDRGIPASLIAVDVASHSPQVDPLLDDLADELADLQPHRATVPFYSTVLDDPRELPAFDAAYWCANLRRPVRFASAVAAAAADRHLVYVEIAPHPVVTHSVARNLADIVDHPVVVPTLRRDEDEIATFRYHLAVQHCAGVSVDWSALYTRGNLADPPSVTFDRKRHWADLGSTPAELRDAQAGPDSPLPGQHTEVPGRPVRHCWRADTGTAAVPWLGDHRVHGRVVMPGAMYYAIMLTCACQVFDAATDDIQITDLRFAEMMELAEHTDISTTVTLTEQDQAECEIFGRGDDGAWVLQAAAVLRRLSVRPKSATSSVNDLVLRHPVALDPESFYAGLRGRGLEHGAAFTGITRLFSSRRGGSFWSHVEVPETAREPHLDLLVHPVLIDLCAQLVVAGVTGSTGSTGSTGHSLVLPVGMGSVRVLGDPASGVYCHARVTAVTEDSIVGDVRLLNQTGQPVLAIDGLRFTRREIHDRSDVSQWFLEIGWHQVPGRSPVQRVAAGEWLIVGEGDGSAETLSNALVAGGAATRIWDTSLDDRPASGIKASLADQLTSWGTSPRGVVLVCGASAAAADPTVDALRRTRRLLGIAQALAEGSGEPSRLYVITRAARAVRPGESTDLGQSALRGLVRVLACEHPELRTTLVDTGPVGGGLQETAGELLAGHAEDEVALRDRVRYAARLSYAPLSESERAAASTRTVRHGRDGCRLRIGRPGDLESLHLTTVRRRPPGPSDVEVRVGAAGVNFRDVLTALDLLPAEHEDVRYRIGFECTGTVSAVGCDVKHVRVGDPVLAADLRGGAFGSFMTLPALAVAPIPEGVDPIAAAGLPIAFLTAWYALRYVGRLTTGNRVLIHSATGGTGLAAVAVARRLGAEVLATAGSEEKRRYLRSMGIAHVMDSRSYEFAEQTRKATGGEGVDVVLNSLSGVAIRTGLEALRPFGRFVELGVRDIISDSPLGMAPLRHNISFSTVDLIEVQRKRPKMFARMLREVLAEFAAGRLKPLHCTTFPLSETTEAFRLMARAGHIGKLVVTVPDHGTSSAQLPEGPVPVQAGGAYIVTGGLRGLGLATAQWLAQQGAGHLVLNGRTPPSPSTSGMLGKLIGAGIRVTVVLGDIAEPGTAERLTAAVAKQNMPLRGVVHCAMVLEDTAVTNVRDDQLERVWSPKTRGAWRLHEATAGHTLDWFAVFSSMASLLGNPGQAAYAAANAWLDGFAAWRTAQGLPTLAVNWGPWGEIGVATDFAGRGYQTIPTAGGFRALHELLAYRRVQTGVIPGEPRTFVPRLEQGSSLFSLLSMEGKGSDTSGEEREDIHSRLLSLPPGLSRKAALEAYIADHIRAVLRLHGKTIDPQTPLKLLGFDSLLSMELRSRIESGLGVRLASNFVWQYPTLGALAAGVAEHMGLESTAL